MTVSAGTRVVGKVAWISAKTSRFAGITPVYNDLGEGWETADPENYPDRQQIFWWEPRLDISVGSVVLVTVEDNPGRDDKLTVREASYLHPVLDHHNHRYDATLDRIANRRIPAGPEIQAGCDLYVWCRGDLLLGPFSYRGEGTNFTLAVENQRLDRVPFRKDENALFRFPGKVYCAPETPPSGYLDCRSDAEVVRTAVRDAVEIATARSTSIPDFLQTRALMQQAANALRIDDTLDDRKFRFDRMARAIKIFQDSSDIHDEVQELSTLLLDHPRIREGIEQERRQVREKTILETRALLDADLADARAELERLRREADDLENQRATALAALERARLDAAAARKSIDVQLDSLESSVVDRVAQVVDDASELLTESVLLRALGHRTTQSGETATVRVGVPFTGPDDAAIVSKAIDFDTCLYRIAEQYSVPHNALRRIHAALRAGLTPITTGNGSSAALTAYATAAFAARMATLPVAHDFLNPVDLLGVRASDPSMQRMHADILLAASRAAEVDGPSMLVLESVNQAPTESFLLPWLQSPDHGIVVPPAAQGAVGCVRAVIHDNLHIAATAVSGATTAPLSTDIWGFCAAIDVPKPGAVPPPGTRPTRLALEARVPASTHADELVDRLDYSLGDYWMIDEAVVDAARRFGAALHEVTHADTIAHSIAECILVPALATSVHGKDLDEAIDAVAKWCGADNARTRSISRLAHRFQRRFA